MRKKFAPGPPSSDICTFSHTIHSSRMGPKRLPTFPMMMFIALMIFINPIMGENALCTADEQCQPDQYCYERGRCVNYTQCSHYNRQEGDGNARTPEQCGSCLIGYVAELLATGYPEILCKKSEHHDNSIPNEKRPQMWVYITSAIVLAALAALSVPAYLLRKRNMSFSFSNHGPEWWFKKMGGWTCTPTAPPPDNGAYHLKTFYNEEPPVYSSLTDKNGNIKVRNNLVSAVPYHSPNWVQHDPTYGHDHPDNVPSTSVSTVVEMQDEDTTPSTWVPEQVVISVPSRPFQFAAEQRDNVANDVLVREDCGSTPEPTEEANPGPSADHSRRSGESYRGPSVQINQMITLNVVNTEH